VVERVLCLLIRLYQLLLSPFLGGQCRFEPTCSRYALVVIPRFGAARGSWLTLKRLSRCHPFCAHHGYDPPPELSSQGIEAGASSNSATLNPLDPASARNG
jgi:putative membrane protein insertion efficiency factor